MRINTERNCKAYSCETYQPIPIQVAKSAEVTKTNTLHQFDTAAIIGLPSPVGKVPIVFYVRGVNGGHRGIVYYDDRDTVCWMYPESEHAEWCRQPYDLKYDAVEDFDDGVSSGKRRKHGILELWVSAYRRWYNGQIMYRPHKKIQGCGNRTGGYPTKSDPLVLEEKKKTRTYTERKTKQINRSCGCRKG